MKQIKQIAFMIITIFMVMGAAKTSAQTMMNPEDIEYYLDSFQTNHTVYYNQELIGSFDGDRGTWVATINRSTLPQLEETIPNEEGNYEEGNPIYGFLIFVYDQNDDHCYCYDWGLRFPYLSSDLGSLEYDGTGIMQYLRADDDEEDTNHISQAYFQCGDIWDLYISSGTTHIRLVIYE